MTILNFSQLSESVFRPNFPENTFLKTKPNFSLIRKCFPLINFPEDKQIQESLKSNFPKTNFLETNKAITSGLPFPVGLAPVIPCNNTHQVHSSLKNQGFCFTDVETNHLLKCFTDKSMPSFIRIIFQFPKQCRSQRGYSFFVTLAWQYKVTPNN